MSAAPKVDWQERFEEYLVGNVNDLTGEQRAYCPIHEDPETSSSPSASFNWTKDGGVFSCFSGGCGMSISALWKQLKAVDDLYNEHHGGKVRDISSAKSASTKASRPLPSDDQIKIWQDYLMDTPVVLEKLKTQRGLTTKTIKKHRLGYDPQAGRYTIPVYDIDGELINVRKYKINAAKSSDKMMSIAGHGEAALFMSDILKTSDTVLVTEGEMDAILARQHGFPAMSHTAGAGTFRPDWGPAFKGKVVYIVYDADASGSAGASKAAGMIRRHADAVYVVLLPKTSPGYDITNFFVDSGLTAKDLQQYMDAAKERSEKNIGPSLKGTPLRVTIEESMNSKHVERPITFIGSVAGSLQKPYLLPRDVEMYCNQDAGPKCASCTMSGSGKNEFSVEAIDEVLLAMRDKNPEQKNKELKLHQGVPASCAKVDIEVKSTWSMEELIVMPSVDDRGEETQNPIERTVMNVGPHHTPVNTVVEFVGTNRPDAKDQRGILQTWKSEKTDTNLDRFEMTRDIAEELLVFQPKAGQTPLQRMGDIARDLEANVTHIYGRHALHIAYDLVWHSVMDFNFQGKAIEKGWVELLVMGDTRTGKSEVALQLSRHYRAGVMTSGETASLAGLIGGAQQHGSTWMIKWGTLPMNDRRLVVIDEAGGLLGKNIIEQMSSIRSSGKAQITKIVSSETSARTRLIWIANPVDGRRVDEMASGGIEAIATFIKNPEDIARFDLAMAVASGDVKIEDINMSHEDRPKVQRRFNQERCSNLVSWCWSRLKHQIVFDDGVENYVVQEATKLGKNYITEPPLIQGENVRMKVARLSVAVAGRVFSTDDTFQNIVVKKEHVDSAVQMIDWLYGQSSFGYKSASRKEIRDRKQAEENKDFISNYIGKNEKTIYQALLAIRGNADFRIRDFEEFGHMDKDEAGQAVRTLMEYKMVRRMSKGYLKMQPALTDVLQDLEEAFDNE